MAYLNEDGLETLVGKIKGQAIELTSAEYRQLPATKNTDNKLYFVTDEAYAYQIDDEPTANSSGLVKSGGVYNWTSKIGSGTLTTTAQTLIPAVNEVNAKIGSTDISTIGDGTVTGAVDALNTNLNTYRYYSVQTTLGTTVAFWKFGRFVLFQHEGNFELGAGTEYQIATIPAGVKPAVNFAFAVEICNSGSVVGTARVRMLSNSGMFIMTSVGGFQEYHCSGIYLTNSTTS